VHTPVKRLQIPLFEQLLGQTRIYKEQSRPKYPGLHVHTPVKRLQIPLFEQFKGHKIIFYEQS